jgi:hypothetical protein
MADATTVADSAVFLHRAMYLLPQHLQQLCTSLAPPSSHMHILHWAANYETNDRALRPYCLERTVKAIVSGLCQRRALGFLDHFVFGMVHCGLSFEVFAGTWAPKAKVLGRGDDIAASEGIPGATSLGTSWNDEYQVCGQTVPSPVRL